MAGAPAMSAQHAMVYPGWPGEVSHGPYRRGPVPGPSNHPEVRTTLTLGREQPAQPVPAFCATAQNPLTTRCIYPYKPLF